MANSLKMRAGCILRQGRCLYSAIRHGLTGGGYGKGPHRLNLCSGARAISGFINIDIEPPADLLLDLSWQRLPFTGESVDTIVCMSAINYFTHDRAQLIVKETYRVLRPGGVARFGVQDLALLARHYVNANTGFFNEKMPDGSDRYPGASLSDKFAGFFYRFPAGGSSCRYVYDFQSLSILFRNAGFVQIEQRPYRDSRIPAIEAIDNRPEQMFFLEAVK